MKKILILLFVLILCSCAVKRSADVEVWNWTFYPIRDMEAKIDGTTKIVPGLAPYYKSWTVEWQTGMSESPEYLLPIGIREMNGIWTNVTGKIYDGRTYYVSI